MSIISKNAFFTAICFIALAVFCAGCEKELTPKEAEDKVYEILKDSSPKGLGYYRIDYDPEFEPAGVPEYVTFSKRYDDGVDTLKVCFHAKERSTGLWCEVIRVASLKKDSDGYYIELSGRIFREK